MSNYTPVVSYGPKDSLAHGDPNKALKGVQIDVEFAAIAAAISSKQDAAVTSGSFTATFAISIVATATVKYVTNGAIAIIYFPTSVTQSTSSPSTITMTGMPSLILPVQAQNISIYGIRDDGSVASTVLAGVVNTNPNGIFVFQKSVVSGSVIVGGNFTAGTSIKGILVGTSFTYGLT